MDNAVSCFYCGKSAKAEPYGNKNAVIVVCSSCTKANSVVEYSLEDAVTSWNKEQSRLANSEKTVNDHIIAADHK